jgi:hypothetical protein
LPGTRGIISTPSHQQLAKAQAVANQSPKIGGEVCGEVAQAIMTGRHRTPPSASQRNLNKSGAPGGIDTKMHRENRWHCRLMRSRPDDVGVVAAAKMTEASRMKTARI